MEIRPGFWYDNKRDTIGGSGPLYALQFYKEEIQMKRFDFCGGWTFAKQGETPVPVTLPHDAQILETRDPSVSDGGHGYFPGGVYVYEKTFDAPEDWRGKHVEVAFEGVYKNATVALNGRELAFHPYGYTAFSVPLERLKFGEKNTLTVTADNSKLPNSRWYTGSGIYRPVWLYVGGESRIERGGVKITTLGISPARIRVDTAATCGDITVEILDGDRVVAEGAGASVGMTVPAAKLWSAETPNLYTCRVTLRENGEVTDVVCERFGIRELKWSPKGFFVNGEETLLRGGCIHHDNGILGAASFPKSDRRRVEILKANGFNAIRSAHNPTSRAIVEACDELGMYLMDETFDMWYSRKTKNDYGNDFPEWWQRDVTMMVERDYNHPSVVLYSIGNEVSEPAEEKGVATGKALVDLIHSLDPSRPVTCGANLMIMAAAAAGKGIYNDGDSAPSTGGGDPTNTSADFNEMVSQIGAGMNNSAVAPEVDALTSPFLDCLDIAGYNYASGRYPLEGEAHPGRVVVGSETFPQDIWKNWEMVKKYPYLIGDFMWVSWDYLGEAGIGAWSYDGAMPFNRPHPWFMAGSGAIDILGDPDASCRYAETVWGLAHEPVVAVKPVNHPGVKVTRSVWRGTNAMESWSWRGCDGNDAEVEVYSNAAEVELFLNGKSLGRKPVAECMAIFKIKYAPGKLEAVSYGPDGSEAGRGCLVSSEGGISIALTPEDAALAAGEIGYVPVTLVGENGIAEMNADRLLHASVEGGELLAFGSANPCTEEQFHTGSYTTFYGRALAVVRSNGAPLTLTVSDGEKSASVTIAAK